MSSKANNPFPTSLLRFCETKRMDRLREWPEPIVRVQALSESGIASIPSRYVKPPAERPELVTSMGAATSIPTVDLAVLMMGAGGAGECRAAIRAMSEACKEWGFFQVVNHGVSPDLMKRIAALWRSFFSLPMEEKQKHSNSPRTYEGYGSRVGVEKDAILDWGDYYFLYLLPLRLKDHTKWPSLPTFSGSRDVIEEYGVEALKLCRVLMKALSLGLGLEAGELLEAFGGDGSGATIRANYYPKCPQPELTLGLSPHSDPGGLTILLPDERVAALQVRKGGEWVTVQPVAGALIVNVGDQIQILSNAIYKSVEHRVIANSEADRLSVVFFYNPRSDIPLEPVRSLAAGGQPALYLPMTFDEYRLFIRTKGPKGKTQVEALKAQ